MGSPYRNCAWSALVVEDQGATDNQIMHKFASILQFRSNPVTISLRVRGIAMSRDHSKAYKLFHPGWVLTGQVRLAITFKHCEATIQQVVHMKRRDRNSQAQEIREERRCANEWMQANAQRAQLAARTGKGSQGKRQGRGMWGCKRVWITTSVLSPEGR